VEIAMKVVVVVFGAVDGAIVASLIGALSVWLLGWQVRSTPALAAFLAIVAMGAFLGGLICVRITQRRALRSVAEPRES
jgi:hypothetical protein